STLLTSDDKLKKVDVYMNNIYQGTITKGSNKSRYTLKIKLGTDAAKNLDRARNFDITFKTDKTRKDTIHYVSPKYTITVPSPMLGQWVDSQTRQTIYLKDEIALASLVMRDINQLQDLSKPGRFLLRAGIGDVNLFGTIKKLSTNKNATFKTVHMKVKHTNSDIFSEYKLELANANTTAGSIRKVHNAADILYVDGDASEYIIPYINDAHINSLQTITGTTDIYIEESSPTYLKVSKYSFKNIQEKNYNFGVLNVTDETINYNIISSFTDGNEHLYYGYMIEEFNDKPIEYTKTLRVCNNGFTHMSSVTYAIEHNSSLFRTFNPTLPEIDGLEKGSCKDIPIVFSFYKPKTITDINLTIRVTSAVNSSQDWVDVKRLRVSDETFTKLYFLSNNEPLNSFAYAPLDGVVLFNKEFNANTAEYLKLPLSEVEKYHLAVSPQNANYENSFLIGVDKTLSHKNIQDYTGAEDREPINNTFTNGVISCTQPKTTLGADTLAKRYGEVISYITYEDIDYFKLDALPALTNKYTSFKTTSDISKKSDITLPFYIDIVATNLDKYIKVFDEDNNEVTGLVKTYNSDEKSVTIINDLLKLDKAKYTIKLLKDLNSSEGKALLKDQEWGITLKKTNLISTGQIDSNYGVSMIQIRDNANDIVHDLNTKLIWQDDNDTHNIVKNHDDAQKYCKDLTTSYSDSWRVPSRDELLTLVDYRESSPSMHNTFGYISKSMKYWSSTPKYGDNESAWYVDFTNGETTTSNNNDSEYNIRCVINSSDTNESFYIAPTFIKPDGSEIVSDTNKSKSTYLLWQDDESTSEVMHTFEDAIEYCENLTLNDENNVNYSDWRVPNIKELSTIVDDSIGTQTTPAIEYHFKNTAALHSNSYWSSSTSASDSSKAWSISFEYAEHKLNKKSSLNYVRCVSRGGM
ncbi:MAG: hypothetical protein DRG78_13210, partial [Epsilonproteobacteria bacterium]